jgi:hypothetical protein
MDPNERHQIEAAMAKISGMKREVEADPAAAMQASLDVSMKLAKRRLLQILLCVILAIAAATVFYVRHRA